MPRVSRSMAELARLLAEKFPDKRRRVAIVGDILIPSPDKIDDVDVVVSGDIAFAWEDEITSVVQGAQVLGLDAILADKKTEQTASARSQVISFSLSRQELEDAISSDGAIALAASKALADMASRRQSRLESAVNYSSHQIASPGARLIPGRIVYEKFPIYYFFLRADPETLASMLPPGLTPLPIGAGFYVFTVSCFTGSRSAPGEEDVLALRYHEVAPSIPCIGPGGVGLYTTEFYVDCSFAVSLGRELYGYPKVFGFSEVGERCLEVTRGDALIFDARWREAIGFGGFEIFEHLAEKLFPGELDFSDLASGISGISSAAHLLGQLFPLESTVKTWTRKRVLSATATTPDEDVIDELVEVPFVSSEYSDLELLTELEVDLPVRVSALPGECVGAIRFDVHIDVGTPVVVRDYLES